MLTDNPSKKNKANNKPRSLYAKTNKQWSDSQRIEAVKSYLLLGNLALTGRVLGIPEITLRQWKASAWWKDVVEEIKTQEKIELNSRLKKIVDASLTAVEDRLLNGDYQYDQKTGEIIRKPVNLKDAHRVAIDMQNRQDVIEKSTKEDVKSDEAVENKLLSLAEKFAEMATMAMGKTKNDERTIDVVDVDVKE